MNVYQVEQWRRVIAVVLFAMTFLALLGLLLGVGWWVWAYLLDDPLPYHDPDAFDAGRRMVLA